MYLCDCMICMCHAHMCSAQCGWRSPLVLLGRSQGLNSRLSGVVASTFTQQAILLALVINASIWEAETGGLRPGWAMQEDPVSSNQPKNKGRKTGEEGETPVSVRRQSNKVKAEITRA